MNNPKKYNDMKRILILLFAIGLAAMSSTDVAAMSTSKVRRETRFLTDKMAYELNLNTAQYNDAYEINFDFIHAVRNIMNNVVSGQEWALDEYYSYLDIRNDDLRWVLNSWQYRRFMQTDYFYRPIYADSKGWSFRVYITYSNPRLFYFGRPHHFRTYRGGHYRTHYNNVSYYKGRYHHKVYVNYHSVRDHRVYYNNRRADFGRIKIRPNSSRRSVHRDDVYSVHRNSRNASVRRSHSRVNRENVGNTSRRSRRDAKIRRKKIYNTSNDSRIKTSSQSSEARKVYHSTRDNRSSNRKSRATSVSSGNRSSINKKSRSSKAVSNRRSSSSSSSSRRSKSNASVTRVSSSRSSAKIVPASTQRSSKNKEVPSQRSTRSSASSRRR